MGPSEEKFSDTGRGKLKSGPAVIRSDCQLTCGLLRLPAADRERGAVLYLEHSQGVCDRVCVYVGGI